MKDVTVICNQRSNIADYSKGDDVSVRNVIMSSYHIALRDNISHVNIRPSFMLR